MFEPKGGTMVALIAATVIAAIIFLYLVVFALMVGGLILLAAGYGIYFVVARPQELPGVVDKYSRIFVRYLTHIYMILPFATVGLVAGYIASFQPMPQYSTFDPLGWLAYTVLIWTMAGMAIDMMIVLIGNWVRGHGWGFFQEQWLYQVPPRVFDTRDLQLKFEAVRTAINHCQERIAELRQQNPNWGSLLDLVHLKIDFAYGIPSGSMEVRWDRAAESVPGAAKLLEELYHASQVRVTLMPMEKSYTGVLTTSVYGQVPGFSAEGLRRLTVFRKDWQGEWRSI